MNNLNHASLEASKRLHDAGIILDTNAHWIRVANSPMMLVENRYGADEHYPAPCMAELWRELPDSTCINKDGDYTKCWVDSNMSLKVFQNENPTDALIELWIWVKEQNRERIVKKLIDHADKLKW